MSSTSVRSREYHINCGQTVANKEGKIEMPPKTAKRGPSTIDVEQGPALEILAEKSELRENGELIANGQTIAVLDRDAYSKLSKRAKDNKTHEGNDR